MGTEGAQRSQGGEQDEKAVLEKFFKDKHFGYWNQEMMLVLIAKLSRCAKEGRRAVWSQSKRRGERREGEGGSRRAHRGLSRTRYVLFRAKRLRQYHVVWRAPVLGEGVKEKERRGWQLYRWTRSG